MAQNITCQDTLQEDMEFEYTHACTQTAFTDSDGGM